MADNWSDNADDNDTLEILPDDPGNEAGANKDADGVDDAAKPKRNRLPTAGNIDENPDDANLDDAPKPKRGRGRPRKDDDPLAQTMRQ